jgi:hypothetical protein
MLVWDWLKRVGGKVGLLRFVSTTSPAPPEKVPMRTVTLRDLVTELQSDKVRTLAESPAELLVSFDQIFAAAGVTPPAHGWTIERLGRLLHEKPYDEMPRADVQKAILQLLSADNVHVQDVVKDAVARDRAMDAYELFARARIANVAKARHERLLEISQQIKGLQAEAVRLQSESKDHEARWRDWFEKKVAREKEMAWTLAYLVDEAQISIGGATPPQQ